LLPLTQARERRCPRLIIRSVRGGPAWKAGGLFANGKICTKESRQARADSRREETSHKRVGAIRTTVRLVIAALRWRSCDAVFCALLFARAKRFSLRLKVASPEPPWLSCSTPSRKPTQPWQGNQPCRPCQAIRKKKNPRTDPVDNRDPSSSPARFLGIHRKCFQKSDNVLHTLRLEVAGAAISWARLTWHLQPSRIPKSLAHGVFELDDQVRLLQRCGYLGCC